MSAADAIRKREDAKKKVKAITKPKPKPEPE